jgi:hypothetical protein
VPLPASHEAVVSNRGREVNARELSRTRENRSRLDQQVWHRITLRSVIVVPGRDARCWMSVSESRSSIKVWQIGARQGSGKACRHRPRPIPCLEQSNSLSFTHRSCRAVREWVGLETTSAKLVECWNRSRYESAVDRKSGSRSGLVIDLSRSQYGGRVPYYACLGLVASYS